MNKITLSVLFVLAFYNSSTKGRYIILYHGTSIATLISEDSIIIASDSKVNTLATTNDSYQKCKIQSNSGYIFSISGLSGIDLPEKGKIFDAFELVHQSINPDMDFKKQCDFLRHKIRNKLETALNESLPFMSKEGSDYVF